MSPLKTIPNQLLIATGNSGKYAEIAKILEEMAIEPISLQKILGQKFSLLREPEESGNSFAENALIKARYYAIETGFVAIADDSGLCVKALGGSPGIHSARFAIDEFGKKNFEFAAKKIFDELAKSGIGFDDKPEAKFVCNLCVYDPKNHEFQSFEGEVSGYLSYPPRGNFGFGYDPIFVKNGEEKTFGEIEAKEKDKISHRAMAFELLKSRL